MRIEDIKLDFDDVLIRPKRSTLASRKEVELERSYSYKYATYPFPDYTGIPIIAANMDTIGTFEMADAMNKHNMMTAIHKHYSIDEIIEYLTDNKNENFWFSMGITTDDLFRLAQFHEFARKQSIKLRICIDVANGYQESFVQSVKHIREQYKLSTIMAGNVVTADMTEALILAGADVVKVGIGPGSVCTTRTQTGVGYPQLSAIIECADAAHGLGGHICADGGCKTPGDVAKAFGAGADFVMLGGMLAGHDECKGDIIDNMGRIQNHQNVSEEFIKKLKHKAVAMKFYGMSSKEAQEKHNGGLSEYRAPEGKSVEIPYRGPVENTIREILGGLRSACTYVGAKKLKELSKRTTFVRVSKQKNDIYGTD